MRNTVTRFDRFSLALAGWRFAKSNEMCNRTFIIIMYLCSVIRSRTPRCYYLQVFSSTVRSSVCSFVRFHSVCVLFCFRSFIDRQTYTHTVAIFMLRVCIFHTERDQTQVVRVQCDRLYVRFLRKYSSKYFSQSLTFDTSKRILKNGTRCARAFTHT